MVARPHVRFLAEDIWDTPEDGNRYEVIDGDLYMTPPPVFAHQFARLNSAALSALPQGSSPGHHRQRADWLRLDDETGLQPDLVYVANEHRSIITERGIEGVPDLVVEILSPSTRSPIGASSCAATRRPACRTTGSSIHGGAPSKRTRSARTATDSRPSTARAPVSSRRYFQGLRSGWTLSSLTWSLILAGASLTTLGWYGCPLPAAPAPQPPDVPGRGRRGAASRPPRDDSGSPSRRSASRSAPWKPTSASRCSSGRVGARR